MEPDILATPGENLRPPATLPTPGEAVAAAVPANGHAVSGATPAVARPASNGHGVTPHPPGPNGHGGYMSHDLAHTWGVAAGAPASSAAHAAAVIEHDLRSARSFYLRTGKRLLDVAGAAAALVIASPLLLLAAIAIKLESRGPVLYRSTRIGRGGRPFTFLKLRSMVHDADRHRHRLKHLNECDGPVFKMNRDPRVTRVGRFLRVTSIDEIPQFVNVLVGHMSLVGPRPPIPEEVAQYEPWQLRRLDVRPGLTCLWQISGRSRIGFQEWMRLDLEYIRRQSFALDMNILIRTVPAVLSREGAY